MFDQIDFYLGSHSPRRQQLLKELGMELHIVSPSCDETYPDSLHGEEIPRFLSRIKAESCPVEFKENTLLLTADTIVWTEEEVLGKPRDREDACRMLHLLSGKTHDVITGFTLKSAHQTKTCSCHTQVFFTPLTQKEIDYYIDTFSPYDKAGAYGIQEWIGLIGIEKIHGDFYNVMGLPVSMVYREIKNWKW